MDTSHPGSENLIPAKPGEVRNPHGRPKGSRNRATIYNHWLEMINDTGITEADAIALAMILKAKQGDVAAAKEAMDSGFGKIADKQELTGADGLPLNIGVKWGSGDCPK